MGMPSIGIYSYELFSLYDVDNIIRVGSAGAYSPELAIYDVVLADSAWTESTYAHTMSGSGDPVERPSATLNEALIKSAARQNIDLKVGRIHTCDIFYRQPWQGEDPPYWKALYEKENIVAVEMESFALFHNAAATGKNAACLLTISDSLVTHEMTTAEERQNSFMNMMKIALGTL